MRTFAEHSLLGIHFVFTARMRQSFFQQLLQEKGRMLITIYYYPMEISHSYVFFQFKMVFLLNIVINVNNSDSLVDLGYIESHNFLDSQSF